MLRYLTLALAVLLLLPATLLAGGPPWLCLPLDGVTADNAQSCGEKLTAALEDKLWKDGGEQAVQIRAHGDQWYLAFPMGTDVALADVEGALKGSRFTIPRDRLRLFGHVILEIEGSTGAKDLVAALNELEHVSIAQSAEKEGRLLVTVDMPYPVGNGRPDWGTGDWEKFQRNGLSSAAAASSESPIKAAELPSYKAFRDLVAKHDARLTEIRWSTQFWCRALGGRGGE